MSTKKMIRNLTLGSIAAMVLTACGGGKEAAAPGAPPPPEVSVAHVIHERITEWDEFTGRLQAPQTVNLVPRVSGYIEKVMFQEGALVKKDDVLFLIDSNPFDTEVKRLTADLSNAKAAARLAGNDYDRAKKLSKQRAISTEAVDNRLAQQQQTAAQVASVQAALTRAQLDVAYTRVTAPIDGRVSYARVTEGNFVNAGQSELTSLVSTDTMYAYFDLDEQTYLKYGQLANTGKRADTRDIDTSNPVYMGLANDTGYSHIGHIDFVDNSMNQQTGTIRVRARFANKDNNLIPGLFTRLKLIGSDTYKGILVDNKAIGTDLNNKFVLVVNAENTLEYRPVTLGESINGLRIVTQGLSPDDVIVVNGLQRVRPTMKIKPKSVAMASDAALAALHAEQQTLDTASAALSSATEPTDNRG
ncbi:efflux RND transporter periplasmic adaptor subunit [Neptunomonas antarctica]|uniref:Membrane fusion protein, multidrug efflux system n=1 Tax=Neptunomonas antarctica TaxID=619304 RepID=A0A1N7LJM6_9GAMM|nr:efflux RND transporter periplasmic adaptor subunit [Neptunomonas antarctica]SIS74048.1 membrane fusion protein, multidrug efflux system [Neptunomonas antarctica]